MDSGAGPEAIQAADHELRVALEGLRELDRVPEPATPSGKAGAGPILSLAEAQQLLPDDQTTLLVYDLGRDESVLWLVRRDGWHWFSLPPGAELEAAAEAVWRLFEAGNPRATGPAAVPRARDLAGVLLGPVLPRLRGGRVVIVPDGALAALPFEALPLGEEGEPALAHLEISEAPSVSVAAALAARAGRRSPAARPVAALGNPRYAAIGEGGMAPLPESAREVEAVLALAPVGGNLAATGAAASKALVQSGELSQFRTLHFAVHGRLDTTQPELSGLVLAQRDAAGEPCDGDLRAHEISRLDLPADLVVLSACETARGAKIRGEGLVGLPHAFLEAGATRVVVSLWQVRDLATAELMRRFYQALWSEHLPPAEALRQAQLSMSRDPDWNRPRDWAGFVVVGAM